MEPFAIVPPEGFDSDPRSARSATFPAFPIRTIRLGIAAMIILLLTSTFFTWRVGHEIRDSIDSQVKVLTNAQRLEHYGVILEMSVKAVVALPRQPWGVRYYAIAVVALMSSTGAYAAAPGAVTKLVASCCSALAACCEALMACCG